MHLRFLKIFFISSLLFNGWPNKIFKFQEKENTTSKEISTATLKNIPKEKLPNFFVICSTHKQEEFNTKNTRIMYSIYSNEDFQERWFSIGLWANNKLWVNVKTLNWYSFSILPLHLSMDWFTICVEIDTIEKSISASIGGGKLHKVYNVTSLDEPPRLHLRIGVVDLQDYSQDYTENYQYHGMITKLNVFHSAKLNITKRSKNPCNIKEEDIFIKWDFMQWKIVGYDVMESSMDDSKLCSSPEFVYFRIPLKWTKEKGLYVCKVKVAKMM